MDIPRYWARAEAKVTIKGQAYNFIAYKGSDQSLEAAQVLASTELSERIARKERGEPLGSYPKHGAPLREEIIEDIIHNQERIAVITRNSAGSLVLNTARVMFIDIDLMQSHLWERVSWRQILKNIFEWPKSKPKPRAEQVLERIHQWYENHTDFTLRVYRTKAGFRLLVSHTLFDPESPLVTKIMEELACDNRYRRLCAIQSCFRARLTPKYYRIRLERPPGRYPWQSAQEELLQRDWELAYHQKIKDYDVCILIEILGDAPPHPEAQIIMDIHDKFVMSELAKPLA